MGNPLQKIYDKIPKVKCKGLCQEYCGSIAMSNIEYDLLIKESGREPSVTMKDDLLQCDYLTDEGKCSQYDNRPFICRLWGASQILLCPHDCEEDPESEDILTIEETDELMRDLAQILRPNDKEGILELCAQPNCTDEENLYDTKCDELRLKKTLSKIEKE